jgi:hypothetical protein
MFTLKNLIVIQYSIGSLICIIFVFGTILIHYTLDGNTIEGGDNEENIKSTFIAVSVPLALSMQVRML